MIWTDAGSTTTFRCAIDKEVSGMESALKHSLFHEINIELHYNLWSATVFAQVDPWSLQSSLGVLAGLSAWSLLGCYWAELSEVIKSVTVFINKELIKIPHENLPCREKLREPIRCNWKQLAASPRVALVNHSILTMFKTSPRLGASLTSHVLQDSTNPFHSCCCNFSCCSAPAWSPTETPPGIPAAEDHGAAQDRHTESCAQSRHSAKPATPQC